MAMNILIIFCIHLFFFLPAWSQINVDHIKKMRDKKDYTAIAKIYLQNKNHNIYKTSIEIADITSEALDKKKLYLESSKLKLKMIKTYYGPQHKDILNKIKSKASINLSQYPESLMILYTGIYQNLGDAVINLKKSDHRNKIYRIFNSMRKVLEALEYQESKIEEITEKTNNFLKNEEEKVYRFSNSLFIKRTSWQDSTDFYVADVVSQVLISNSGTCLGGDIGYENISYRVFSDGCVLIGQGTVHAQNNLTYQQANVPVSALQLAVGAGMFVSISRSELGFKIPISLLSQSLTAPSPYDPGCSSGCKIGSPSKTLINLSLYGKWQFKNIYFLTEYGKNIKNDNIMWSLGLGYKF